MLKSSDPSNTFKNGRIIDMVLPPKPDGPRVSPALQQSRQRLHETLYEGMMPLESDNALGSDKLTSHTHKKPRRKGGPPPSFTSHQHTPP
jgi:hypothetical protein